MKTFKVTIRSSAGVTSYDALAGSSMAAWCDAAELAGDVPCGITVTCAG